MTIDDIDRKSPEWDALWTLFGAYLNQDLDDLYGGPWEAVASFCQGDPASAIADAADEVRRLLDLVEDEKQAEEAVGRLGLEYRPPGDGWTYRGWLAELEKVLRRRHTART